MRFARRGVGAGNAFLRRVMPAIGVAAVAACGGGGGSGAAYGPTEIALLSVGSPGKDEDPSVVSARDGSLHVAWFSERNGNSDVYVTRTTDGVAWADPVRVTTDPGGDFAPSLAQGEDGTFHLAWFRWTAPYRGHIWYSRSADGLAWDPADEVQVTTTADVDDWVPTLVVSPGGALHVFFVSALRDPANPTSEIYVTTRAPGASTWSPPVAVPGLNSPTENDHLPFAARVGDDLHLVWVRYAVGAALPWESPKSDVFHASSADGTSWSPPMQVTNEPGDVANLFPAVREDLGTAGTLTWLSTRTGSPAVHELPLANVGLYPLGLAENSLLPAGYSHRVVSTRTPDVLFAAWVDGPEGAQEVYVRFYRAP